MPLVSQEYAGNYLKAGDLKGRRVTLTIEDVTSEKVGDDRKLVISFRGKDQLLVLNKTNANTIAEAYGDDTDDWISKKIELFPTKASYQGKQVDAIRVNMPEAEEAPPARAPAARAPQTRAAPRRDEPEARGAAPLDDDIPF